MSAIHPPETNGGTVTSWLPLTTTYSAPQSCSSVYLAHGDFATGEVAYVFDPTYGISVDSNVRCWPPEATTWWAQSSLGNTGTTVELGPFVCPAAYTTATTSVINSLSTLVACCPSGFHFFAILPAPVPGQCFSDLKGGQVITYASPLPGSTSWVITSGAQAAPTHIQAVQVNGYIFATPTSASTSTSTSRASTGISSATGNTSPSNSSTSSSSSSSTSAATTSNTNLSTGAIIGIAIGASTAMILICCAIAFLFLRRHRSRKMKAEKQHTVGGATGYYAVNDKNQPTFEADGHMLHEIGEHEPSHELQ